MNKQFIFIALVIAAVVGFYNVITSVLELQAAEHEVDKTQQELLSAQSEKAVAQDRYDNVVKYGCANPMVGQGFVSCPN
jgi:Na+/H+ antiporter NhaB